MYSTCTVQLYIVAGNKLVLVISHMCRLLAKETAVEW